MGSLGLFGLHCIIWAASLFSVHRTSQFLRALWTACVYISATRYFLTRILLEWHALTADDEGAWDHCSLAARKVESYHTQTSNAHPMGSIPFSPY